MGGATAILCSVKCSPVRDTLNLSIYLSIRLHRGASRVDLGWYVVYGLSGDKELRWEEVLQMCGTRQSAHV